MTRTASRFRQRDVTRALKAARAAGVHNARVEIDTAGKIIIITGNPDSAAMTEEKGEWDLPQ